MNKILSLKKHGTSYNRFLIFGNSGSGKSILIQHIIMKNLPILDYVFILTSTNDLADYQHLRKNKKILFLDFNEENINKTMLILKSGKLKNGVCVMDDMIVAKSKRSRIQDCIDNLLYNSRHFCNVILSTQNLIFFDPWQRNNFSTVILKYCKYHGIDQFYRNYIQENNRRDWIENLRKEWQANKYMSVLIDSDDKLYKFAIKLKPSPKQK